jgi:hypothetical protein
LDRNGDIAPVYQPDKITGITQAVVSLSQLLIRKRTHQGGEFMQSLAFLWFQLQMTQQYLHEKTFGPAQAPANSANLNTPIGRCDSDKAQYSNTPALHHSVRRDSSTSTKRLLRTGLYIAIAAFVQQVRCSQLESFTSDVQAIVSVVHPEKSGAATLQLPGQLSAHTDAPIYAQTSGYVLTSLWLIHGTSFAR